MIKLRCENMKCCNNSDGNFIDCYDEAACQTCDPMTGVVTKKTPEELKTQCKKCENGETINFCTDSGAPDCCGGTCWNSSNKCDKCEGGSDPDQQKLVPYGDIPDTGCCQILRSFPNQKPLFYGRGIYKLSEHRCEECDSDTGNLKPKVCNATERCCDENGLCIDNCLNCDKTEKITQQEKQECRKCTNGTISEVNGACVSGQVCCNGQCCDEADCCNDKCTTNTGCSYCDSGGFLVDRCSNPDYNIGVNNPESDQFGRDVCCGPSSPNGSTIPRAVCWDPIKEKCKKCENGNLINKCESSEECCPNGECRDNTNECKACDTSSEFGGIIDVVQPGHVCCEKKMVPEASCCNGKIVLAGKGCCGIIIFDTSNRICCGGILKDSNIYACCDNSSYPDNKQPYNKNTQQCCGDSIIDIKYHACCAGTPYEKFCEVCINNHVRLNYDNGCDTCLYTNGVIKNGACKKRSCCSKWQNPGDPTGTCYDEVGCPPDTCDNGVVIPKANGCNPPSECCGETCWNPSEDKCKKCSYAKFENNVSKPELVDKCASSKWTGSGLTDCCGGECWSAKLTPCRQCVAGSDGKQIFQDNLCDIEANRESGNTSCCNGVNSNYTCYNPCTHDCNPGTLDNVVPKENCAICCNNTCCDTECCNNPATGIKICCPTGTTCQNGICCPTGKINCGGTCCDSANCIGGVCKECPTGEIPCGEDYDNCCTPDKCCNGECINFPDVCCAGTKVIASRCCNNAVISAESICCVSPISPFGQFVCDINTENCCGSLCCEKNKTCCNNTDCCDEACCSGPNGGCYNENACQECKNGSVQSKCEREQGCCDGMCYSPKNCQTCVNGLIGPYVPSGPTCSCVDGSEICLCDNFPTGWTLSESATADSDGVFYGSGGLSTSDGNWSYDGIPPEFNSNYSYIGYMSIYVTCNDGTRRLTSSFNSISGTTNVLPQSTNGNPCC